MLDQLDSISDASLCFPLCAQSTSSLMNDLPSYILWGCLTRGLRDGPAAVAGRDDPFKGGLIACPGSSSMVCGIARLCDGADQDGRT